MFTYRSARGIVKTQCPSRPSSSYVYEIQQRIVYLSRPRQIVKGDNIPDIVVGRDDDDVEKYGKKGTIFIGKHIVGTGEDAHLTSPVLLDVLRPHILCLMGKRGSGKCLDGDTLITLSDGSQAAIKDIAERKEDVLSLDDKLKIVGAGKTDFFSRKTDRMIKITLRSGKEIKLTPEHPLLTVKGWKEARDLGIGSRIATPRRISAFGNYEMPEHEVKLLAYLIAEGHTKKIVLFSNSDERIVNDFRDALYKFDSSLVLVKEKENHYRVSSPNWKGHIVINNALKNEKGQFLKGSRCIPETRGIRKLIEREKLFGLLSTQKFLSDNIMKLRKEHMALFLSRLFSCDGSIYNHGIWQISYASSSERLIRQIHSLLLRFDIVSKLRKKKIKLGKKEFRSYELVINSENTLKFIGKIGFFGRKEERQKTAVKEITSKLRNPNVDTVPQEIWEMYRPKNWAAIGRAMNYAHPKAMCERVHYSPSRQTLLQIARHEQSEYLTAIAESDIFWDEIVRMELMEGDFTVYDICVPEHHNFVANDIIVHNSYSAGIIAEEISKLGEGIKQNLCVLIVDPQGVFWTMKSPSEKDMLVLREWGLEPAGFDISVYIPEGQEKTFAEAGVDYDSTFTFAPGELSADEWMSVFGIEPMSLSGILLQRAVEKMAGSYTIDDIINRISDEPGFEKEKPALQNYFLGAKSWGIFGTSKAPEVLVPGKISILDVSLSPANVRSLLVALISKKIFLERVKARRQEELADIELTRIKRVPMPWLIIDEAHNFMPNEGITPSTEILKKIVKEGRQPGITLALVTQQPEKLHPDALSQCDMIISHRLTSENDVKALKSIMQTYMLYDIEKYLNELPKLKGTAIILDDNSERLYKIRMRPRQSWHAGSSPIAL